jgi:acylphosphatase
MGGSPAGAACKPMSTKRVHVIIRGRVTGVFFRAATQREAKRLGVTGWVKNRPDGSIEIVAEGEEEAIKEIISWANHGPSTARVDNVDVRWRGYTGEFSDFRITE